MGALLEGNPTTNTNTNTVTRDIYVLDVASGTPANGVTLYVYQKNDVISPTYDAATTTLRATISLPIVGGNLAVASMAANDAVLVVGTNQSPQAVKIQKSNLAFALVGGFSPPINVVAITCDQYGYITITFGSVHTFPNGYYVLDRNGSVTQDGGGGNFMLNTLQAVLPGELP